VEHSRNAHKMRRQHGQPHRPHAAHHERRTAHEGRKERAHSGRHGRKKSRWHHHHTAHHEPAATHPSHERPPEATPATHERSVIVSLGFLLSKLQKVFSSILMTTKNKLVSVPGLPFEPSPTFASNARLGGNQPT
jgi:hypothetical protein